MHSRSRRDSGFFFLSVQKLSEFLSSEEIGEEHDKSSELRSADNHSKYQAVVSNAVSLQVKWLGVISTQNKFFTFPFPTDYFLQLQNLFLIP